MIRVEGPFPAPHPDLADYDNARYDAMPWRVRLAVMALEDLPGWYPVATNKKPFPHPVLADQMIQMVMQERVDPITVFNLLYAAGMLRPVDVQ